MEMERDQNSYQSQIRILKMLWTLDRLQLRPMYQLLTENYDVPQIYVWIITIFDENLRKFTAEKGRCRFSHPFVKKIKNFEEHLWVINNFNKKIKKTAIKKRHFYFL